MVSQSAQVTVQFHGARHRFAMLKGGSSILDAAESAGVLLPSLCRAGLCATCRARRVTGEVEMQFNLVLDAEELQAGYVLLCQARPVSDEVVLEILAA